MTSPKSGDQILWGTTLVEPTASLTLPLSRCQRRRIAAHDERSEVDAFGH
ncbi:MAG: hypothetical protein VYC88_06285 [SAR324 cluster bacterium]|nr:hypothetical protein [SAR324 cluster bacterium]